MNTSEFISYFQETLDIKSALDLGTQLKDIPEWDSLGKVVIGTFIRMQTGRMPSTQELNAAQSVSDLMQILNA